MAVINVASFLAQSEVNPRVLPIAADVVERVARASLGPSPSPVVDTLMRLLTSPQAPRQAWAAGRRRFLSPCNAAFITAAHACVAPDLDAVDVVVTAAALASADQHDSDGPDLLAAIACGLELGERLAATSSPQPPTPGAHLASMIGQVAAAGATARLCDLDVREIGDALGLAATQAAGLVAPMGTDGYQLQVGKAAAIGVEASELALRGFTGPRVLIGRAARISADLAPSPRLDGLGSEWLIAARRPSPWRSVPADPIVRPVTDLLSSGNTVRRLLDTLDVLDWRSGRQLDDPDASDATCSGQEDIVAD